MDKIKIDTELFIQIIESEDGIHLDHRVELDGEVIHYYKGRNGKTIPILVSREFIYNNVARMHMRQLGIDELILQLFPS